MSQVETTKFKLMDSFCYKKDVLIDILADRISCDFKLQKDNAKWRIIHSTKLAKEFFKCDFTVNSIIFVIGQKIGLYITPENLRKCNTVDDVFKLLLRARDDWNKAVKMWKEECKKVLDELNIETKDVDW